MKWFGRKSGREASRPALAHGFSNGWRGAEVPRSYEERVRAGYLANPVAQRAVRLVAEGVGAAPLLCSEDAVAAALARRTAGQGLLETAAMQLLLHGNAFLVVLSSGDSPSRSPSGESSPSRAGENGLAPALDLFALRPERVTIERDARGWPVAYLYKAGEAVQRFDEGRVVHVRLAHPLDDHYGLGCLEAAAGAIAIHNAATRWNAALLDNAARPSGALVYQNGEGALSAEQYERLRGELAEGFAGAANAGRPLILEGGLSWQTMSLTPADMDFVGLKAAAAREIALAFGVPPMLLGLPGDAAYANYREANRVLWRQAVLPMAGAILGAIEGALRASMPELRLTVDLDQVPALAEERALLWGQATAADFLTREEKRRLVGFGEAA